MKAVAQGTITVTLQCTPDEYLQLAKTYPNLMNGHSKTHTQKRERVSQRTLDPDQQKILDYIKKRPEAIHTAFKISQALGLENIYTRTNLLRFVKWGYLTKEAKGQYKLDPSFLIKPTQKELQLQERGYYVRDGYTVELGPELFEQMLLHSRQLLKQGCSDSNLKKLFRNVKCSQVEAFLAQAIQKGIVQEVSLGTYQLVDHKIEAQITA
jgi:hypothetical protein